MFLLFVTPSFAPSFAQAEDTAAAADATAASSNEDKQDTFRFPRWPENRPITRERMPLAPPGPYMSSALSDFSFERPPIENDWNTPRHTGDLPDGSIEKYSPYMPWPSHTRNDYFGYRQPPANWPESDRSNGTGDAGPDDKWPDDKWPDWPDNYGSNTNWPVNTGRDNEWREKWSHKWPHAARPDDHWPANRKQDDNWTEDKWPEDKWTNSNWPENQWPDRR